ncbi:MAG: transglycosylase SLT domain-containing protein [Deltaproteobacteria bacterium]|nr:transglycosylase SLT domain-containing protein [Deltaproteobacteria bacterium]
MRSLRPALTTTLVLALAACSTPEPVRETSPDAAAPVEEPPDAGPTSDAEPLFSDVMPAAALTPGAPLPPIARTPDASEPPPRLEELARWFEGPPLAGALALWKTGQRADAAHALDAFTEAHPEDPRALPARFLAAWMLADGEPDPTIAGRFEALAADWPLMADACHYHAAVAHLAEVELGQARAAAKRIAPTSVHWGPAQAIVARVLHEEGHAEEARALLEAAVGARPDDLPPEGWARLAALRDEARDATGAARARLELAARHPDHELGKAALAKLETGKLPAADRVRLARALLDAGRADATRAALVGIPAKPKEVACEAWVLLGRAWERRTKDKSAPTNAWKWYKRALECTGDARADATFLGGRNRMRNADPKTGMKLLRAHVEEFPQRSTADDALHMLAVAQKRPREEDKQLVRALDRYPRGDQADEIAWDLVGKHLEKRAWKDVARAIDKILDATKGRAWSRHGGRYHYWKGRALWELGKRDEARALWKEIVHREPLTWYATLALSRLAAEDPEGATRLVAEHAPPAVEVPDGRPTAALWADDHLRRAVEWARLAGPFDAPEVGIRAFQGFMAQELAAVDPKVRGEDWTWTSIALWQLAGDHARAMRLARSEEHMNPLPWPTKGSPAARRWRLAYPRAFEGLVTTWAEARGLEPGWIWSIARVESNFEPTAVSWANAIGLMQIIPPTAAFLAKDTTIEPTRDNLMKPEVALELGTKYLARLLAKHELYPLASAGYNAGGGAVSRWRRERGDLELDEFVERIPYREANNYAKSVTQTLARYLWLYEGRVLTLPIGPPGLPGDPSPTEGPAPAAADETAPEAAGDAAESASEPAEGAPGDAPK